MDDNQIQKNLSELSMHLIHDNVVSVAMVYECKDGNVMSFHSIQDTGDVFSQLGAIEMLRQRAFFANMQIPELQDEDDDDDD
jgi:hypothetical protein